MGRSQNHRTGRPFKTLWIMMSCECDSWKDNTLLLTVSDLYVFLDRASVQFFEMGFMPCSKLHREISKE